MSVRDLYYDVYMLPCVIEEDPESLYYVCTCDDENECTIAVFDDYDDAVDFIVMIEDFCKKRGIPRIDKREGNVPLLDNGNTLNSNVSL